MESTSFSPKNRMAVLNNDKAVWKISLRSFRFKLPFFKKTNQPRQLFTGVSRNMHKTWNTLSSTDKKHLCRESYILEEAAELQFIFSISASLRQSRKSFT